MSDRDPLSSIVRRQRRDIRLLYRTFADSVRNAVAQHPDPDRPITEADRVAIMHEVDAGLDVIWGAYPGDPNAAVRQITVRDTRAVRFRALDTAIKDWRRALPPPLRERIEQEAQQP